MGRTARGPDGVAHPVIIAKHPKTTVLIPRCIRFSPMLFFLKLLPIHFFPEGTCVAGDSPLFQPPSYQFVDQSLRGTALYTEGASATMPPYWDESKRATP